MGKSRSYGPAVEWKLRIAADVALQTELRYMDKITKRADYGAKSRLVTALLREFNEKCKELERSHPEGVIKQMIDRLIQQEMEKAT